MGDRDLVWTQLVGKLLGLGGCPIVYDKRENGEGVGQVPGYMITDGSQPVNTDATTMVRSDWARVRKSICLVFRGEKGVRHPAIVSDGGDLVCHEVKSQRSAADEPGGALVRSRLRPRETTHWRSSPPPPNPPSSQSMAHPNSSYAQPHGTLAPGQTISVNKYTVQVERYLSQGAFHRLNCDRPFWNTTAHWARHKYRRLRSRLPRTDLCTGLWDDTSCS